MRLPEVRVTPIPPSAMSSRSVMPNNQLTGSSPSITSDTDTMANVFQINQSLQPSFIRSSILGKCYDFFYSSNDKIGKKRQVAKIMLLLMLPIIALAGVTIRNLVDSSNENQLKARIRDAMLFAMETGSLIDNLQKERDRVALFVTSQSSETRILIEEIFRQTDMTIAALRSWKMLDKAKSKNKKDEDDKSKLRDKMRFKDKQKFQEFLDARRRLITKNPADRPSLEEVKFYTIDVIKEFIDWITDTIQESKDGALWKTMMAYLLLVMAKENTGVERTLGGIYYVQGGFKQEAEYQWYLKTHFQGKAQIADAMEYSSVLKKLMNSTETELTYIIDSVEQMRSDILQRREIIGEASLDLSALWLSNMSILMEAQQDMLLELGFGAIASIAGDKLADYNTLMLNVGFFLIAIISSPLVIFIVHAMMDDMSQYAATLMGQACGMAKDRERADRLLYGLLPKCIVEQLRRKKKISAETFSEASLMQSRVSNFAEVANSSQPVQIIDILNRLYDSFDDQIEKFDCHKAQVSSDWILLVSGVPVRNGKRHVMELAVLALHLRHVTAAVHIDHMPGVTLLLQSGIATGPIMAAVVGISVPRYCLFGSTVTTAQAIEAECDPNSILISESARNCLSFDQTFQIEYKRILKLSETELVKMFEIKSKRGYDETV